MPPRPLSVILAKAGIHFNAIAPYGYHFNTMERMTVEQIAEEALSLPSEARAQLADRLVESLDPAEDSYIRKLWAAEALRRRDEIRDGRVQAIPGEEVLARVRQAARR
jgi:putative addiction module component (TIGR02574 family)